MAEAADKAEREESRLALAPTAHPHTPQIDWHDFVIVETIEFYDDEDPSTPPLAYTIFTGVTHFHTL